MGQETEGAKEKAWTRAFLVVSEGRKGKYRAEKFEQVQDQLVGIILRLWAIGVVSSFLVPGLRQGKPWFGV